MPTDEIVKLNGKIDRILFILNNDRDTGSPGLVEQVKDLKQFIYNHVAQYNIDQAVKRGKNAAFSFVCGIIGGAMPFIVKLIFKL